MHRLLLIDDDEALAGPLSQYLARFDLQLEAVTRPSAALARLATERFDALILDGMLPEMDGFEFCKRLRAGTDAWRDIPVLMLTARGDLTDRVVGLELGADDYMPKPFGLHELTARLRAVLRRHLASQAASARAAKKTVYYWNDWQFDRAARTLIEPSGKSVPLTKGEHALLCAFIDSPGRPLSRDYLLRSTRVHDDVYDRSAHNASRISCGPECGAFGKASEQMICGNARATDQVGSGIGTVVGEHRAFIGHACQQ